MNWIYDGHRQNDSDNPNWKGKVIYTMKADSRKDKKKKLKFKEWFVEQKRYIVVKSVMRSTEPPIKPSKWVNPANFSSSKEQPKAENKDKDR